MSSNSILFDQRVMRGLGQYLTETKSVTTLNKVAKGGAKELPSIVQIGNWTPTEVIRFLSCPQLMHMVARAQLRTGRHPDDIAEYSITASPSDSPLVGHYRFGKIQEFDLVGEARLDRIFRVNGTTYHVEGQLAVNTFRAVLLALQKLLTNYTWLRLGDNCGFECSMCRTKFLDADLTKGGNWIVMQLEAHRFSEKHTRIQNAIQFKVLCKDLPSCMEIVGENRLECKLCREDRRGFNITTKEKMDDHLKSLPHLRYQYRTLNDGLDPCWRKRDDEFHCFACSFTCDTIADSRVHQEQQQHSSMFRIRAKSWRKVVDKFDEDHKNVNHEVIPPSVCPVAIPSSSSTSL